MHEQGGKELGFADGEPDEADFSHMFKILRKQKRAMDTMVDSVNSSTRQLMVMEREMDMMQGSEQAKF